MWCSVSCRWPSTIPPLAVGLRLATWPGLVDPPLLPAVRKIVDDDRSKPVEAHEPPMIHGWPAEEPPVSGVVPGEFVPRGAVSEEFCGRFADECCELPEVVLSAAHTSFRPVVLGDDLQRIERTVHKALVLQEQLSSQLPRFFAHHHA